ncbi:hypothetical protein AZA_29053 [Nitrospirillum viridazoti Y2]|nr:hypothetical protein AZA_29053 [Nitrospirillum amazonense Y2]
MRILHELAGQLADVHQPVLVHAHVDEGAKGGDVGDHAFQHHAGLKVLQFLHAVLEGGGLELGARVTAGLLQFLKDILNRWDAETIVGVVGRIQAAQEGHVADQRCQGASGLGQDTLHHRVGFGVHGGAVQGGIAVADAQEAGGLFESLGAQARHVQQLAAVAEGAVRITVIDDVAGNAVAQARHPGQQGHRGGVEVHAHAVHAILDHGVQGAGQLGGADVMLVLADADGLRIDLHQFGQRVLQAPRDGDGAAQADVQVGEFLGRHFRCGIDRGASLRNHDLGQFQLRELGHDVGGQLVRLARRRAVADGDQADIVPAGQGRQRGDRAHPVAARLVRVDGGGLQQLAGGVHHGDLHTGADARIQPQGGALAGGRRQQQAFQVTAEDGDGLILRPVAHRAHQVQFQMQGDLGAPGPAAGVQQPAVGGPAPVLDAESVGDRRLAGVLLAGGGVLAHLHGQVQDAAGAAAEQGQGAVRGQVGQRLRLVEIVGELGALLSLALHDGRDDAAVFLAIAAQEAQQLGVFTHALHQDGAGAVQGRLGVGHALLGIDIGGGAGFRIVGRIVQQQVGQGLQPRLPRDHGLGPALGLIGQVQIFQPRLGVGGRDLGLQLGRQLALLLDGFQDGGAPLLHLTQVAQAFIQGAQLRVIQAAGRLLAVAGDEGHGRAFVQQGDCRRHLFGAGG